MNQTSTLAARRLPMFLVSATLMLSVFLALPVAGAHHLNGTWSFEVALDGQGGTATITLEEGEGGALTGTYSGALGEESIDGTVDGKKLTLSFDSQAGKVEFRGELKDDGTLAGTCSYGQLGDGTFTAKKSG